MAGASARSSPKRPCALRIAAQASIAPGTVTAWSEVAAMAPMPCASSASVEAARRRGRSRCSPRPACRARRSGRSSRRRCRSSAARPRRAPRPPYGRVGGVAAGAQRLDGGAGRQRMRRRRHALAGDHRRAAGQMKVTARSWMRGGATASGTATRRRARSRCRAARRAGDDEAGRHVDHADHHQNEERRRSRLRDQQELDQHGDEQDASTGCDR